MAGICGSITSTISSLWAQGVQVSPANKFLISAVAIGIILGYPIPSLAAGASTLLLKKKEEIPPQPIPTPVPVVAPPVVTPPAAVEPIPVAPKINISHLVSVYSLCKLLQIPKGKISSSAMANISAEIRRDALETKIDRYSLLNELLTDGHLIAKEQMQEIAPQSAFLDIRKVLFPHLKNEEKIGAMIVKGEASRAFVLRKSGQVITFGESNGELIYSEYKTLPDFCNSLDLSGDAPCFLEVFSAGSNQFLSRDH
ncbi:MAG TPA: hypothetical protein VLE89_02640 [Chlamydiales bacterium]|nr:hypothetical protein [Chlamydiales bacterium]